MKDKRSQTARGKRALAFRLRPETAERLAERAKETGQTQTALVERFIEEGLRTDHHPLIHFRDGFGGRRAALLGSRLDVWQVIETVHQNERSVESTADYLGLPIAHVRACLRYYADCRDEIDEWTARVRAVEEREEENWRRQQELLA